MSAKENVCFLQDSIESKNAACRDFLGRLNESLAVLGGKLQVDARYECQSLFSVFVTMITCMLKLFLLMRCFFQSVAFFIFDNYYNFIEVGRHILHRMCGKHSCKEYNRIEMGSL